MPYKDLQARKDMWKRRSEHQKEYGREWRRKHPGYDAMKARERIERLRQELGEEGMREYYRHRARRQISLAGQTVYLTSEFDALRETIKEARQAIRSKRGNAHTRRATGDPQ